MFDLEKNPEVESLDAVPEDFRALYAPKADGEGFAFAPALAQVVAAIIGQSRALGKSRTGEREARRTLEESLGKYKALGDDPDAVAARIAELEERAKGAGKGAADLDRIRQEMTASHQKALGDKDAELQRAAGDLQRYVARAEALGAITSHGGNPLFLLPHVQGRIRVERGPDGTLSAVVVDQAGEVAFSGTTGLPMTPTDLVAEFKTKSEYGPAFASSGVGGGGTPPGPGVRGRQPVDLTKLSPQQKIAMGIQQRQRGKQ